jgi:hypothetical protein
MTKTRANGAPKTQGAAKRRSAPAPLPVPPPADLAPPNLAPPNLAPVDRAPADLVKTAAATTALGVGAGTGAEWALDAGRPKEILERLLDRPDAARLVRQTPVQPLYLFIRSLGLADARELLALCTPEQVQVFLDLDGWERDHIQPRRLFVWLQALRELGHERFTAHLRRLDPELLTTLIGPRVRVYELNDEDHPPPEEAEGLLYTTPDRMFLLDIVGAPPAAEGEDEDEDRRPAAASDSTGEGDDTDEAEQALLIRSLLDDLYRSDLDLARSVVMAARWDLGAETSEKAYRFRSGRMADLGYVDYYDALKVYMLVDPLKPPAAEAGPEPGTDLGPPRAVDADLEAPSGAGGLIGPQSAVWRELVPRLGDQDFTFGRAAALLSPDEQSKLLAGLLMLSNQVMAADRIELGDLPATRHSLQRVAGYLSLGLEFRLRQADAGSTATAKGEGPSNSQSSSQTNSKIDLAQAAELLRSLPLLYLFRLGHSLTVQLRKLAGMLVQSGLTTLAPKQDPGSLLPAEWAVALGHLLRVRPLYPLALEPNPPLVALSEAERRAVASVEAQRKTKTARPFGSLRELGRAAGFLERLGLLDRFFTTGLGLRKDTLAATLQGTQPGANEAQLTDVLGTLLANALLDRPPALVPLKRRDLPELLSRARGAGPGLGLHPTVRGRLRELLTARIQERALDAAEAQQLLSADMKSFIEQGLDRLDAGLSGLPPRLSPELADAVPAVAGLILSL